ncbi:MAG: hypothetical protein IH621_14190 [Krumholzibacteria bacterium]|nr:hypothetical protein [Candidatus Krumholzibacteria bacterium]
MDTGPQTFEEILFHGRYHIIGAIFFVIFFAVFIQEAVREILGSHALRRGATRSVAFGPLFTDARLGHTMTDGGEPRDDDRDQKRQPD